MGRVLNVFDTLTLDEYFEDRDVWDYLNDNCGLARSTGISLVELLGLSAGEEASRHQDNNRRGTLVMYLEKSVDLLGGELKIGNKCIEPRVRDMVYIAPRVWHAVLTVHQGRRLSGVINLERKGNI